MTPPKLKLYVDVVSPFGYIAYHILRNDPAFSKCEITYVPLFLGGVMKACGNIPPLKIKNKSKYIESSRKRLAKLFAVPMAETMPEGFPPLTLTVMRAICALTVLYPDQKGDGGRGGDGKAGQEVLVKVLDELLKGMWVKHERTFEKEGFVPIFEKIIGKEDTEKVMEMLPKEGKEVLQRNTDKALEEGAFGLPWFVATDENGKSEGFWGVDSLKMVGNFLSLELVEGVGARKDGWKSLL